MAGTILYTSPTDFYDRMSSFSPPSMDGPVYFSRYIQARDEADSWRHEYNQLQKRYVAVLNPPVCLLCHTSHALEVSVGDHMCSVTRARRKKKIHMLYFKRHNK